MRILSSFTVLALQVFALSPNLDNATIEEKQGFLSFCAKNNRHYSSSEEMDNRFGLYMKTKNMIDNAPPSTFEMALNYFADRTDEEKQAVLNMKLAEPRD